MGSAGWPSHHSLRQQLFPIPSWKLVSLPWNYSNSLALLPCPALPSPLPSPACCHTLSLASYGPLHSLFDRTPPAANVWMDKLNYHPPCDHESPSQQLRTHARLTHLKECGNGVSRAILPTDRIISPRSRRQGWWVLSGMFSYSPPTLRASPMALHLHLHLRFFIHDADAGRKPNGNP